MEKAKRVVWRLLAASVCVMAVSQAVHADSLDEQRSRYAQIKQAWDNRQMDTVQALMPTLKDYPLYPYLEYRQITDDLMNQPTVTVNNFIQANPTLPPARTLKSRFVNELARREDWRGLLAFSPDKPGATEAQCNYYYAKWATGQQEEAWVGAKELWLTGKSQPNACDPLFSAWRASGKQDPLSYLERIRLAMKAGNTRLVTVLAGQMPADYQTIASAVIGLANDPNTVLTFARTTGATDFTRQMAAVAFASVARDDVENARLMIPQLVQAQQLNDDQTQELRDIVAWRLMGTDVTDEQARWRDDAVMRSNSVSLVERRVRMALGTGDRRGLNTWLARLPMDAKEKDEWRYWQADLLLERGRDDEAKEILHSLMQQRGFYPMAAAQRLGEEYTLKIDKAPANANPALTQGPEMARVRELMYWNLDNTARSEWANLVTSRTTEEKAQLARYAFDNRWWDLSVQATIAGKLWDHLEERFPLAYKDLFDRYTSGKDIPQSYAMAIARQESAWNPKVRSPVGASGLMQIMPGTATHTVKMFNIPGYSSPSQLLDPETNINIGTSYLQYVYQQFGNNRIFASAAYNAGPGRVRTWLGNSAGRIDAVAFVESIPFSETRGYVKNVLAYDAYYRYFMGQKDTLMSDAEWQIRY
ncbi:MULTISPECIES: murein transglycosylase [Enterobacter cloacae complex]|uniref:murein transglycosylase n=1 Tax=Enterobacter cloacae complex TaxID=354276 RepID=UPI0005EEEBFF|nr:MULTISPECIES: murein transglycosylase [Enterobacter cloacae complex]AVU49208.1 murein transglycosylase [Enterobacter cloacae]EHE7811327.1 murein transglycosylase [Enterobacter hormaechei]EHF3576978.1 murein transglycosylase [Enterobacter hormaechei]KJM78138.1 lytic murein transglycosylase [Enterobacter hormaechei subsp. xiangfangensis]KJN79636.1 lytic murein transglycosylase [Enterobacter hormaechei subsp. xiangfangensis]